MVEFFQYETAELGADLPGKTWSKSEALTEGFKFF